MEVMDMKQTEMSGYLKVITAGVGVLLAVFLFWFLPLVLKEPLTETAGENGYRGTCGLIWVSAVPAFLCLIRFWEICESIRRDRSFSMENAGRLKRMSQYMLADAVIYTGFLVWFFLAGWYRKAAWLIFPVFLAVFISVTLVVLCAALSHLVQKASEIQEEQELTI
jgi:MFS family permease